MTQKIAQLGQFFTQAPYLAWVIEWKKEINNTSDEIRKCKKIMQDRDNPGRWSAQSTRHYCREWAHTLLEWRQEAKQTSWMLKQQEMATKQAAA